jgi:hypothetical protein
MGDARGFVRDFGITFPGRFDAEQSFSRKLGVYGLPQTYFITEEWEVLDAAVGEQLGRSASGTVTLGAISERAL